MRAPALEKQRYCSTANWSSGKCGKKAKRQMPLWRRFELVRQSDFFLGRSTAPPWSSLNGSPLQYSKRRNTLRLAQVERSTRAYCQRDGTVPPHFSKVHRLHTTNAGVHRITDRECVTNHGSGRSDPAATSESRKTPR